MKSDLLDIFTFRVKREIEGIEYRKYTKNYDFYGFKRLYHLHIRKTGGTSINKMFLALSGNSYKELYKKISEKKDHRIKSENLIYVGWTQSYIKKGNYFYAFSHLPFHKLNLPKDTFTFTCFRDPAKRLISHYNMLMFYKENNIAHPCMKTEGKWLGSCFEDFLERIPKEHLNNQLYMLSENLDIDEALKRIRNLSYFFFTESFERGIEDINRMTGLNLKPIHVRKAKIKYIDINTQKEHLYQLLEKEYKLLQLLKLNY